MSSISNNICMYNQTGFCRFQELKSMKTPPHARIRTVAKDTLSCGETYSKQKDAGSNKTVHICMKVFILHSRRKSMKP